jgi:diacylglycerol kinase family enzyme
MNENDLKKVSQESQEDQYTILIGEFEVARKDRFQKVGELTNVGFNFMFTQEKFLCFTVGDYPDKPIPIFQASKIGSLGQVYIKADTNETRKVLASTFAQIPKARINGLPFGQELASEMLKCARRPTTQNQQKFNEILHTLTQNHNANVYVSGGVNTIHVNSVNSSQMDLLIVENQKLESRLFNLENQFLELQMEIKHLKSDPFQKEIISILRRRNIDIEDI